MKAIHSSRHSGLPHCACVRTCVRHLPPSRWRRRSIRNRLDVKPLPRVFFFFFLALGAKRAARSSHSVTVIPWVYLSPPPGLPPRFTLCLPAVVCLSADSPRPRRSRRSVVTGTVKSPPPPTPHPPPEGPSAHWVPLAMAAVVSCEFQARRRGNSAVMRQLPFLFLFFPPIRPGS